MEVGTEALIGGKFCAADRVLAASKARAEARRILGVGDTDAVSFLTLPVSGLYTQFRRSIPGSSQTASERHARLQRVFHQQLSEGRPAARVPVVPLPWQNLGN